MITVVLKLERNADLDMYVYPIWTFFTMRLKLQNSYIVLLKEYRKREKSPTKNPLLVSKADEDDDSVRTWMKCRSRSNFCQCNARVEVF